MVSSTSLSAQLYSPKSSQLKSPKKEGQDAASKAPKRPLSAYNYFFKEERAKVLKLNGIDEKELEGRKRKHRRTPGMVGFRSLAKCAGAKWKSMSTEERAPYQAMFEKDRERYRAEMQQWDKEQKELILAKSSLIGADISENDGVHDILAPLECLPLSFSFETNDQTQCDNATIPSISPETSQPVTSNGNSQRKMFSETIETALDILGDEHGTRDLQNDKGHLPMLPKFPLFPTPRHKQDPFDFDFTKTLLQSRMNRAAARLDKAGQKAACAPVALRGMATSLEELEQDLKEMPGIHFLEGLL